ncbi:AAA family ATPase [Falsiroseomonas sp. CW058]|uniref:bifunctional aminoglycoside phosphotransferase/ATP-binding protein n=1 Tax=Falsiroseomonas sp. CW058 TaxID=3388664 RepID=UPI003D3214E9
MTIPPGQAEAAALLRRLTGAEPVETHISAVFVGRDDAFKLKKAVDLGFVDFTTPAARERFARRELELNRPLAPGIYREVLPVTRGADGAPRLGGAGPVLDWVLRMAPVPAGDFLDAVAARGGLGGAMLDAVAEAVLALHDAAPVVSGVDAPGRMAAVLEGNRRSCLAAGLDPAAVGALADGLRDALGRLAPAMAARAAAGRVRRCHGDLHLGNLCLWEGRPTPFDALEFDEALATVDVGYDLAFLLMDLDVRLDRAAANRVMNRVLARGFDIGLLAPLPAWLALRAMVRAHVAARRSGAAPGGEGARYLAAAARYLVAVPPRLVAVGGLQGTGKTHLARRLAPLIGVAPGALHLRTDEIRKRRAGIAPERPLPPAAYAEAESIAVHAEMFDAARRALAAGHSVVLDAVFLNPAHRATAAGVAAACGVRFDGFWLEAPVELLRARVAARREAGLRAPAARDASDADEAVLMNAARADAGEITWRRLDATRDAFDAACKAMALSGAA